MSVGREEGLWVVGSRKGMAAQRLLAWSKAERARRFLLPLKNIDDWGALGTVGKREFHVSSFPPLSVLRQEALHCTPRQFNHARDETHLRTNNRPEL